MPISRQNSNRIQIDAVSLFTGQMNPHCFENAPLLAAVSNRHGIGNSLDRCRVNRRCNCVRVNAASFSSLQRDFYSQFIFGVLD